MAANGKRLAERRFAHLYFGARAQSVEDVLTEVLLKNVVMLWKYWTFISSIAVSRSPGVTGFTADHIIIKNDLPFSNMSCSST